MTDHDYAAFHGVALNEAYPLKDRLTCALKALDMKVPYAIAEMQEEVVETTRSKGWYETDRTFGEDIALLHSEVSEMLEAFRDDGVGDTTAYCGAHLPDYVTDEFREEHASEHCTCAGKAGRLPKPEGTGGEAADVLIRLLDTCSRYDIDLAMEFRRKADYNKTRPHRHGGKSL